MLSVKRYLFSLIFADFLFGITFELLMFAPFSIRQRQFASRLITVAPASIGILGTAEADSLWYTRATNLPEVGWIIRHSNRRLVPIFLGFELLRSRKQKHRTHNYDQHAVKHLCVREKTKPIYANHLRLGSFHLQD